MRASTIKQRAKKALDGVGNDFELNPTKAVCNNCNSVVSYDIPKNPGALILTLTDSCGGEVFYCPDCGPIGEDALDGVSIE